MCNPPTFSTPPFLDVFVIVNHVCTAHASIERSWKYDLAAKFVIQLLPSSHNVEGRPICPCHKKLPTKDGALTEPMSLSNRYIRDGQPSPYVALMEKNLHTIPALVFGKTL